MKICTVDDWVAQCEKFQSRWISGIKHKASNPEWRKKFNATMRAHAVNQRDKLMLELEELTKALEG